MRLQPIGWIDSLEARRLLSAFAADINFQPASSAVPAGYVADSGAVYADRGNDLTYGWNGPSPAQVVARTKGKALSADPQNNTFAVMHGNGRGHMWGIAVPNGIYDIQIVCGDPQVASGRSQVIVNGTLVVNGKATRSNRWVAGSTQISVTNGVIDLTVPRGTSSKIDFITLSQAVNASGSSSGNGSTGSSQSGTGGSSTGSGNSGGGTSSGGGSGGSQSNGWSKPLAWATKANAPIALAEAQSVAFNGKLYVFGGYNITTPDYQPTAASEVYDPATNTWTSIAPLPTGETHMGVATDGTYIYVAGGYTFDPRTTYQTFATSNVFRYDPSSNTWGNYASLPAPRGAGTLVYDDGQLHFFDGVDTSRNGQTNHWVLNPAANQQWTSSTPLPFSRNHIVAAVLDGKIYAVGGQSTDDDSSTTPDVLVWDPANPSKWTAVASLPYSVSHAMVTAIDGRIVVAGGTTAGDVPLANVEAYDPATNAWTAQTSLPSARLAGVGAAIGNQIVFATGFGNNALQAQTWETAVE